MAHPALRTALLILPLFACAPTAVMAQDPPVVDIDLRQSTNDPSVLEVYLRANGDSFGDVLSGLTFTLRWVTTSPATLGTRVNACPDAINISATPQETNPLLDDVPTGFNYRTYNSFGLDFLADYGCTLPQDEWSLVMSVPVENNTGCTEFNIVNDAWTDAPGNARDYFVSLGGIDATGIIDGTPVQVGDCSTPDCLGVPGGTALPGTACDDQNPDTENDVWSESCVCTGELNTSVEDGGAHTATTVWPNPTNGLVYITTTLNGVVRARVSDALGRQVTSPVARLNSSSPWQLDLSQAATGVYLIELEVGGVRSVERVVKR